MEDLRCAECAGHAILTNGEYVCTNCGLVLDRQVVSAPFQIHKNVGRSSSQGKAYVALGNRTTMVGGMGSFIDYQASRFFFDNPMHVEILLPKGVRLLSIEVDAKPWDEFEYNELKGVIDLCLPPFYSQDKLQAIIRYGANFFQ